MKTAVIYARYSSERQNEQSIEGQLSSCQSYANENDIVVVDTYIDRAMTGKNDNRKEFQRMLKDSYKQAWDYIIVYKLDRFSRNKYEMAIHKKTLRDNGVKLLSAMERIPDTPEGIILESMLEGMAEYYSAELSQKVTRGLNENRKKGLHTGGEMIFGYKVIDKKIFIDEDQAQIVKYIYEQYASGAFVKDIINDLSQKGIYRHGKPFAENTIYRMLKNEKYFGILRHGDEIFTNIYPKIIPDELFRIVQQKNEEKKYGKHIKEVTYKLKGKLWCGYCSKQISSDAGTSHTGITSRYYKCRGRKKGNCKKDIIRKELIENLVIDTTIKTLNNKETLNLIADKVIERNKSRQLEQTEINLLTKEKIETQKALHNLISCMEQGIITKTTKQRIEELEKKLEQIESNILIERTKEKTQITKTEILKHVKNGLSKNAELMIRLLIDRIILFDDKVEIYYKYTNIPDDNNHRAFLFFTEKYSNTINLNKFGENGLSKIKLQINAYI